MDNQISEKELRKIVVRSIKKYADKTEGHARSEIRERLDRSALITLSDIQDVEMHVVHDIELALKDRGLEVIGEGIPAGLLSNELSARDFVYLAQIALGIKEPDRELVNVRRQSISTDEQRREFGIR